MGAYYSILQYQQNLQRLALLLGHSQILSRNCGENQTGNGGLGFVMMANAQYAANQLTADHTSGSRKATNTGHKLTEEKEPLLCKNISVLTQPYTTRILHAFISTP